MLDLLVESTTAAVSMPTVLPSFGAEAAPDAEEAAGDNEGAARLDAAAVPRGKGKEGATGHNRRP